MWLGRLCGRCGNQRSRVRIYLHRHLIDVDHLTHVDLMLLSLIHAHVSHLHGRLIPHHLQHLRRSEAAVHVVIRVSHGPYFSALIYEQTLALSSSMRLHWTWLMHTSRRDSHPSRGGIAPTVL